MTELHRSTDFSRRELAAIFMAAYQDYFVPFKVDEETLAYMVDAFDLGARELTLEVITENKPAIALYEKLGFETTRELEVFSLAAGAAPGEGADVDVATARRLIARHRDVPEPWQREDATVSNLAGREPPPHGLLAGQAAAVYRRDGARIVVLQASGEPDALPALIAALRAKGPLFAVNYPAAAGLRRCCAPPAPSSRFGSWR